MHPSITIERVEEAVRRRMRSLDNPGFCTECGQESDGVEPDARDYPCEHCGQHKVQGADDLLIELF